jgi:hypothetical protein
MLNHEDQEATVLPANQVLTLAFVYVPILKANVHTIVPLVSLMVQNVCIIVPSLNKVQLCK